jgi:GTP pyrophosphokinase
VMDWQREVTQGNEGVQELYSHAFADRIYVFTPNGDVIELPSGATPLDFAYYIHSELGHRCRGAKINGAIVPLTYSLRSGEKVEILTTKQGQPSRDWVNPQLGYLQTSRARAKVLNWFRKQDYDRHILEGHELLEKELKRLSLVKRLGVKEVTYDALAQVLHLKSREEMLAAIGRGDLRMHTVLLAIQSITESVAQERPLALQEIHKARPTELLPTDIVIEGVSNLLTHLARCCKPVPGDAIVGYVTLGRGVSIHRNDCPNLIERFSLSQDRKVNVSWGKKTTQRYPVDLSIYAYDQTGLLHNVIGLLANEHIPVVSVNTVANKNNQTITLYLTIEVDSVSPLSRILSRLGQLQGILSVQRD